MNRRERRAMEAKTGDRFVAKCQGCTRPSCVVHVIMRHGEKDLGICKGCPCSSGKCDACGFTGMHWLGCPVVGLPEAPPAGATLQ